MQEWYFYQTAKACKALFANKAADDEWLYEKDVCCVEATTQQLKTRIKCEINKINGCGSNTILSNEKKRTSKVAIKFNSK
jgi:hypothetical protein